MQPLPEYGLDDFRHESAPVSGCFADFANGFEQTSLAIFA
jgi:hypothetical protein